MSQTKRLRFAPNNTIAFAGNSHDSLSADVRASNTYVIEGHCEAIIPAYLAKPVGPYCWFNRVQSKTDGHLPLSSCVDSSFAR